MINSRTAIHCSPSHSRVQRGSYSAALVPQTSSQASLGIMANSTSTQGQCSMFFRSFQKLRPTEIRCLPRAQGVSPNIDRVVSTSCFYPVEDMKSIIGHSPLWWAAYWIAPAWNTNSPSENHSNWSQSQLFPCSPSASAKGPGMWTVSVYFTVHLYNLGLKALIDPQSFKQVNYWLPRSFCGFSQQQKQELDLKHCYTLFLHLPTRNSPVPKL